VGDPRFRVSRDHVVASAIPERRCTAAAFSARTQRSKPGLCRSLSPPGLPRERSDQTARTASPALSSKSTASSIQSGFHRQVLPDARSRTLR
jgi:hypothetical protein